VIANAACQVIQLSARARGSQPKAALASVNARNSSSRQPALPMSWSKTRMQPGTIQGPSVSSTVRALAYRSLSTWMRRGGARNCGTNRGNVSANQPTCSVTLAGTSGRSPAVLNAPASRPCQGAGSPANESNACTSPSKSEARTRVDTPCRTPNSSTGPSSAQRARAYVRVSNFVPKYLAPSPW
jgi:hypothetical protein